MSRLAKLPPRYWLVVLVVLIFFGLPTQVTSFQSLEWAEVLIFAIVILGLTRLDGYSGKLTFGHGAYMDIGAYTTAMLVHRCHVDYLAPIPLAGLLTGLVGFFLGIPALRLSPLYLALA